MSVIERIEKKNQALGERYIKLVHQSGLPIYLIPKNFSTSFALFGTRYGSIDRCFRTEEGGDPVTVPDGIAHFLEHKMFENADGEDTFVRFSRTGASANAFTSFTSTVYLFSATDHLADSLEILLDFVTHPYFTQQTVDKEQGIIGQEIRMGEDNPDRRVLFDLLAAMYQDHPVRLEIAGTVESIAQIDADLLYRCYHTFYNLRNMALVVCGQFQEEEVLAIADKILQEAPKQMVTRIPVPEKPEVYQSEVRRNMQVAKPLFEIGLKITEIPEDPAERMKISAALSLASDVLYGRASAFFNDLYSEGLISQNFGSWSECNRAFSFVIWSGDSSDPAQMRSRLQQTAIQAAKEGLDPADFERCRRVLYASLVRCFDSTAEIANNFMNFIFDGADLFDYVDLLAKLKVEEVNAIWRRVVDPSRFAMATVLPFSDKEEV